MRPGLASSDSLQRLTPAGSRVKESTTTIPDMRFEGPSKIPCSHTVPYFARLNKTVGCIFYQKAIAHVGSLEREQRGDLLIEANRRQNRRIALPAGRSFGNRPNSQVQE